MKVTKESVLEVLDKDESMTISEIAREHAEGDACCSECGRPTLEYDLVEQRVREVLRLLMDRGRITTTPEWEYRLARNPKNEGL